MEIPWTWVVMMTIYEICYIGYSIYKGKKTSSSFAAGIIFGLWSLCLVSWLNLHISWK